MKSQQAYDKVELIERSIHCFAWGLVGILPFIGIPFAVVSLADALRIGRNEGSLWNPAERQLRIGSFCAVLGLSVTALLAGVIYIEAYWRG